MKITAWLLLLPFQNIICFLSPQVSFCELSAFPSHHLGNHLTTSSHLPSLISARNIIFAFSNALPLNSSVTCLSTRYLPCLRRWVRAVVKCLLNLITTSLILFYSKSCFFISSSPPGQHTFSQESTCSAGP